MLRFAGKPFLEISVQGISGTGVASEIAEWLDLTLPDFEPVFSYPLQGHHDVGALEIAREIHGNASQQKNSRVETINLDLRARFSFEQTIDLGEFPFTGYYERAPGEKKFSLRRAATYPYIGGPATPIPTEDFNEVMDLDEGPSLEKTAGLCSPRPEQHRNEW